MFLFSLAEHQLLHRPSVATCIHFFSPLAAVGLWPDKLDYKGSELALSVKFSPAFFRKIFSTKLVPISLIFLPCSSVSLNQLFPCAPPASSHSKSLQGQQRALVHGRSTCPSSQLEAKRALFTICSVST